MSGGPDSKPLCVDLDGTLIRTDMLWESVVGLLGKSPLAAFQIPLWLASGKANLKRKLADRVMPAADVLPYSEAVIAYAKAAKEQGRQVLLVTATETRLAEAVGEHLGFFDEVIGTTPERNLKGPNKARVLVERFGEKGFDYIGDTTADFPVWEAAGRAIVANASPQFVQQVERKIGSAEAVGTAQGGVAKAAIKALRPHQYAKNALLFVAPLVAHATGAEVWLQTLLAFVAFSLTASSVYVLNDLLDLDSDRRHHRKRNRPFAAAKLSIPFGLALCPAVMLSGLGIGFFLISPAFALALFGYLVLTTAYSFSLKRKMVVDVLMLASLFTYRVLSGGLAAEVELSFWLIAFSMFIFTSLALVKRYSELVTLKTGKVDKIPGRGYQADDLELVRSLGAGSGLVAILVFCLYMNSPKVVTLYTNPEGLWGVSLVLLYWILRVWFLAGRGQMHDDPIVFALRDRVSYMAGFATLMCLVIATTNWGF